MPLDLVHVAGAVAALRVRDRDPELERGEGDHQVLAAVAVDDDHLGRAPLQHPRRTRETRREVLGADELGVAAAGSRLDQLELRVREGRARLLDGAAELVRAVLVA